MATGTMSLQQMLRTPFVLGVFNKVNAAGALFQQMMKIGPTDPATEPVQGENRHILYDIFNPTRTNAQVRMPGTPPAKIPAKNIGQASATLVRLCESEEFAFSKIYGTRDLGEQYGTGNLSSTGEGYVTRQISYLAQRMQNAVEFMISRMFRGGFSVTAGSTNGMSDKWVLGEKSASGYTFNVSYDIPAGNLTNLGGIIDAEWDLADTKILNHMLEINKYSQLLTGYEISDIYINSSTYKQMLANTQLASVRGTAMRLFEEFKAQSVNTVTGESRNIGFSIIFPAMPQFRWHVYDGTSVVDTQVDPATHSTSNNSLYIPDGKAIMTPPLIPGTWYGSATCEEIVREQGEWSPPVMKRGFSAWKRPLQYPPGEALDSLLNYVPLLYNPSAIFYPTLWT